TSAAGPPWSSSSNYSADDRVMYNGAQYRAQRSISASAPPVWTSGTLYNRGTIVQDNGQLWAPQVDNPSQAPTAAPHLNTAQWALYTPATDTADWLSMQGESKTNSRIATVTTAANATIQGAEPGTTATTTALHAPPAAGTSAKIDGVVTASTGHVHVWA